jgi:putative transposase
MAIPYEMSGERARRIVAPPSAIDVLGEINHIQTSGANTTKVRKAAKRGQPEHPGRAPLEVVADADELHTDPSGTASRPRQCRAARRIDMDKEQ